MMNARHSGENLFSEAQPLSGHAAPEPSVHSSLSLPIFAIFPCGDETCAALCVSWSLVIL